MQNTSNNKKTLLAGPWIGEFGWECFAWQGYVRALSRKFDQTIIISRNNSKAFYEDFADVFYGYDPPNELADSFFMYNVDLDLCIRAKGYGAKCLFFPSALAYHRVSASVGGNYSLKKILLKVKSSYILYAKYYKFPISLLFLLKYLVRTLLKIRRV